MSTAASLSTKWPSSVRKDALLDLRKSVLICTTISSGTVSTCFNLNNSRISRFPRLRSTARLESFLAAMMPSRGAVNSLGIALMPKFALERWEPFSKTALNCSALLSRSSGLALPGKRTMSRPPLLNTQARASLGPARADYSAPALCFHARPETVGALPAYFRWLICSLHVTLLAVKLERAR